MKKLLVCVALIAPVSFAWAQKVDPKKLPEVACSELKFSQAILDKYPKAPAACLEGRVYKGVKYGKFNAKVYIQSLPAFITLQFMNAAGDLMPDVTFSIKPRPGAVVYIDGKKTKPEDLKVGQAVTFWIPENRLDAAATIGPTHESWRVIPPPKQ